ncbi:MAG TPA: methyltransferase domain-containing protein [Thermoanaerobaculia bacterium]|nr:methyltransferase domain-containing protein [Thermoanaerobaculia bacterium]
MGEQASASAASRESRRYDLGGLTPIANGRITVNLAGDSHIHHDIRDLDGFLPEDGQVDEFYLCHTLEHVPSTDYVRFLHDLHRKLRVGGKVIVIQTDAGEVIRSWMAGHLSFRAMRTTLFTPADRLRENPFHMHHNMWTAEDLADDFRAVGFAPETFDAGTWAYDQLDELYPDSTRRCWGVPVKNLGVIATKT